MASKAPAMSDDDLDDILGDMGFNEPVEDTENEIKE
jgi:hypothetical protein